MEQDKNQNKDMNLDKGMNQGNDKNIDKNHDRNMNKEQDKKNNNEKDSSKDLDQQEFDMPETERRSNDMTANEQQGEGKRGSTGGLHTGKTSSSTTGDQMRGGDETYTNMNRGSTTSNTGNKENDKSEKKSGIGEDLGKRGTGQTGIGTENRRGSDNMIDDSDEDTDTGTGRSGVDDNDERLK